jgi:HEPN domain-containing protein
LYPVREKLEVPWQLGYHHAMREDVQNWFRAEKALKSLSMLKLKEYPKGHSIIYLAQRLEVPVSMLSGIRDLNPEYLSTRYPDMAAGVPAELYDDTIAERHFKTAQEVLEWVREQIRE